MHSDAGNHPGEVAPSARELKGNLPKIAITSCSHVRYPPDCRFFLLSILCRLAPEELHKGNVSGVSILGCNGDACLRYWLLCMVGGLVFLVPVVTSVSCSRTQAREEPSPVSDGGKWEKHQRRFQLNWTSRADWRLNSVRMENGMIRAVGHLFNWVVD